MFKWRHIDIKTPSDWRYSIIVPCVQCLYLTTIWRQIDIKQRQIDVNATACANMGGYVSLHSSKKKSFCWIFVLCLFMIMLLYVIFLSVIKRFWDIFYLFLFVFVCFCLIIIFIIIFKICFTCNFYRHFWDFTIWVNVVKGVTSIHRVSLRWRQYRVSIVNRFFCLAYPLTNRVIFHVCY